MRGLRVCAEGPLSLQDIVDAVPEHLREQQPVRGTLHVFVRHFRSSFAAPPLLLCLVWPSTFLSHLHPVILTMSSRCMW